MKGAMSVQATKVPGSQSNPKQLVVRRVNWTDKKEDTERDVAKRFCDITGRTAWLLESRPQQDSVDIHAASPDGPEALDLQIVRLWDQAAWKELNTEDAVDRDYDDKGATDLFRNVLEAKGKNRYPLEVRQALVLLIDANPIHSVTAFLTGIEDAVKSHALDAGYKAIWAVGTVDAFAIG